MSPPSGIEAIPNGQWIVEGDTHLSAWAKEHGTIVTDPWLFKWLKPFLKDVKVVWDIGAAIGDHTRQYLDWGMDVVAIEPHPVSFACLERNCPDAMCLNFAASDREGTVNLASNDNIGASRIHPTGEWTVPAYALDDASHLHLPVPDFIKADVEGFEPMAIAGMAGTITRHKPILFIEMNAGALEANGCTVEGLHDTVLGLGYSDFKIYPEDAEFGDPQFDILYLR